MTGYPLSEEPKGISFSLGIPTTEKLFEEFDKHTHNPAVLYFYLKICTLCIIRILWYLVLEGKLWQDLAVFIFLLFPCCLIQVTVIQKTVFVLYLQYIFFFFNIWSTVLIPGMHPCFPQRPLLPIFPLLPERVPRQNASDPKFVKRRRVCGRAPPFPVPPLTQTGASGGRTVPGTQRAAPEPCGLVAVTTARGGTSRLAV